jgi:hypothetical protein
MRVLRNTFALMATSAVVLLAPLAIASNHHDLNGTWVMVPDRCDFGGQSAILNGSVTIWDRQHNITVQRTFDLAGAGGTVTYTFGIDGGESSTIHDGKSIKYKAKWDGNVLKVTTTENGIPTIERFSLSPEGMLILAVERSGQPPMTLLFRRQEGS